MGKQMVTSQAAFQITQPTARLLIIKMAKVDEVVEVWRFFSQTTKTRCGCHDNDYPPFTAEIHGLSQALAKQSNKMRLFWIFVIALCITCGTSTTVLVILEYIEGPTATSTTIRLVDSLEFPAITICPKIPDAFNVVPLVKDIQTALPNLNVEESLDVFSFWIAGMGFANMNRITTFNYSYMHTLDKYLQIWMRGFSNEQFYTIIEEKYGLRCTDFFYQCELGGKIQDCCNDIFATKIVMRRGTCYQTRNINQTDVDDIGRLTLYMRSVPSITSEEYHFLQPLLVVYVNDNHNDVVDFPNFYIYPNQWNRMRFTARLIELLQQPRVCTNKITGKDYECYIRRWLLSNIIYPFNCTLFYIKISGIPYVKVCDPLTIVMHYQEAIQMVWSGSTIQEQCLPGCLRWEYQMTMQQTPTLKPFQYYMYDLEAFFNNLQYEFVKEVRTTTVPGFMSQIGGQFGFFLGLSIITFIQMILYGVHYCIKQVYRRTHHYLHAISDTNIVIKPTTTNAGLPAIYKVARFDEPLNLDMICTPQNISTNVLLGSITTSIGTLDSVSDEKFKYTEWRGSSECIMDNKSNIKNYEERVPNYDGPIHSEYERGSTTSVSETCWSKDYDENKTKKLLRTKRFDESSL